MRARQVVIVEPFKVEVREVELPEPAANQILVATEASAASPGSGSSRDAGGVPDTHGHHEVTRPERSW
jgi:NADPH:quinone reductase-like Zn-dependent oxidoreductase